MTGELRSGSKGLSNSLFSQKDHREHKSYPRLIQHEFLIITHPRGNWHTHIFLVMREGFYTPPKTEVLIILQHHNNDKHDICLLVVEKKQTCKLRLDFSSKRHKLASSHIMLECTHPSKASFPFFYNGFSLFWKFSTPLVSSPTEVLPSV